MSVGKSAPKGGSVTRQWLCRKIDLINWNKYEKGKVYQGFGLDVGRGIGTRIAALAVAINFRVLECLKLIVIIELNRAVSK